MQYSSQITSRSDTAEVLMIQAFYLRPKRRLHRTMYEAPPQLLWRSTSPTDATIFTSTSVFPYPYLRTRSAAAERTTPLECVGVASQSAVLNAGQLISTCVTRLTSTLYMLGFWNLQLLMPSGTHLPLCPLTLQTSCFKLVAAMQQDPWGTGRFSLAP
jgi:hypothetical protein